MLSFQKSASDLTDLGYDFSSPNIAFSSTTIFVSPPNNIDSKNNGVKTVLSNKNINKGKSIIEVPPKLDKKETKIPRAKKGNTQTNCYKWLAIVQSNSMISLGKHN